MGVGYVSDQNLKRYVSMGIYLRNEIDFWKVHGIMNTSGLLHTGVIPISLFCWRPGRYCVSCYRPRSTAVDS